MFDEGSQRGFGLLRRLEGFFLRAVFHRFNLAALDGDLPVDLPIQRGDFLALFHSGVAGVGVDLGFLPVEEFASFAMSDT